MDFPNMLLFRLTGSNQINGTWELAISWNNASQIRRFFNENVIKGGDPSAFYKVDTKILDKLKLLCFLVIMNRGTEVEKEIGEALLPKSIFDKTEINEQYFNEIEQTHEMLEKVLNDSYIFIYTEMN